MSVSAGANLCHVEAYLCGQAYLGLLRITRLDYRRWAYEMNIFSSGCDGTRWRERAL